MTRADRILIVGVVLIALVCVPLVSWAAPAEQVTITGPKGVTRIDPATDASYEVAGRIGVVEIEVVGGQVSVRESCCPDGLCMRAGTLAPGKPLVCAPNGVVVAFGSVGGGEALDAVSR